MQCPNCGNEMAFMAIACPNCGQPGFGSVLNESTFTPEERAQNAKAALGCLAVLFKAMCWVSLGLTVVFASLLVTGWAVESTFVASVVHGGLVFLKWLAITADAFLPFGIISGLVADSTQGDFAYGYAWGQLTGPLGLIVVIFQIPDKPQETASGPPPSAINPDDAARRKAVRRKGPKNFYRFICPKCHKRHKVDEEVLGNRFECNFCGQSNFVTRFGGNVTSWDESE